MKKYGFFAAMVLLSACSTAPRGSSAPAGMGAENGEVQPYIDSIKAELEPLPSPTSYIDSIKSEWSAPSPETSYIEAIKKELPQSTLEPSFIEEQKLKFASEPIEPVRSPIEDVKAGRSELSFKRLGNIWAGVGFRLNLSSTRAFTSKSGRSFSSIYGTQWEPGFSILAEWKPFYSEWWGSLGLFSNFGFSYFEGKGRFATTNEVSRTLFQMFMFPAHAGMVYRLNLPRYIRPYVMAGPGAYGYIESRNDGQNDKYGYSFGYVATGGAAILMDWISRSSTWDMYADHAIKHYYLTVEFTHLGTFTGDFRVASSGVYSGMHFEF